MARGSGSSGQDAYRVVATFVIQAVSEVRIYEFTWKHILRDHGEPPYLRPIFEAAVISTIAHPTAVHASTTDPLRGYLFVSEENTREARPLVVAVKLVDGASARLASAVYRTKASGPVLYRKGGDRI